MLNNTSDTLKATGGYGFLATLAIGTVAIIWPDIHARIPPGFEGALVVGIGVIAGKLTKEKTLRKKWEAETKRLPG